MFDKRGKRLPYCIYMIKQNLTLIGCSLFIFCFLFLLYTKSNSNGIFYYGQRYCLADAYIWFLMPRNYGVLTMPILVLLFINFTKYDQMPSILLRLNTVDKWIEGKIRATILLSFSVAIIAIVVVTFITSLQVTTVINWDKEQSIYYAMNQHINSNIHIGHVIVMSFITMLIRNIFLCISTVLLTMVLQNNILSFLIMITITICEIIQNKVPLFYNYITVNYAMWESKKIVFSYVGYSLFLFLFLGIAIIRCSNKKEWINEG